MEAIMAKRETVVDTTVREDGTVAITFPGLDGLTLDPRTMPEHIMHRLAGYGLREKCTNAAALPRDPATGASATPAAKREAVIRIVDALRGGQWELRGGAGGSADVALLRAAVAEVCNIPPDAARDVVEGWTGEQRIAMQGDPTIAPVFERLRVERTKRLAVGIDTKALLAGIPKA